MTSNRKTVWIFVRKLFSLFKFSLASRWSICRTGFATKIHRYISAELIVKFGKKIISFRAGKYTLIRKYILIEIICITEYISLSNGRKKIHKQNLILRPKFSVNIHFVKVFNAYFFLFSLRILCKSYLHARHHTRNIFLFLPEI